MKPEDLADFCASMTCECCGNEPGVGVKELPGSALSIMWGRKCLDARVVPMWFAVGNVALIGGGLDTLADWWREVLLRTLDYFGMSEEEFNAEVTLVLTKMDANELAQLAMFREGRAAGEDPS